MTPAEAAANPVDEAIAQAKAKANANTAAQAAQSTAVATAAAPAPAPAPYQAPRSYSMDDMVNGGMVCDAFLKVNEDGLKIGDKPDLIDNIVVNIDFATVMSGEAIKTDGKNPQYFKTFDGVKATTGGTWQEAVNKVRIVSPDAKPYMTSDIPMTLTAAAKSIKGAEVAPVGYKLGHSTSTTNRANWVDLFNKAKAAGLVKPDNTAASGYSGSVSVKVTAERKNKAQNVWGVLKFELLGAAAEVVVAQAATTAAA